MADFRIASEEFQRSSGVPVGEGKVPVVSVTAIFMEYLLTSLLTVTYFLSLYLSALIVPGNWSRGSEEDLGKENGSALLLKQGSLICLVGGTRELVRKADSPTPFQSYPVRVCILIVSPADLYSHRLLRSTDINQN